MKMSMKSELFLVGVQVKGVTPIEIKPSVSHGLGGYLDCAHFFCVLFF